MKRPRLKEPRTSAFQRYRSCGNAKSNQHAHTTLEAILHLQSISESLVHLGDLGRDAQVDGAVTDLDDEATDKVGVNLVMLDKKWYSRK